MTSSAHNKEGNRLEVKGSAGTIVTLGDLREFISRYDLPEAEKAQLRSAIKRADELVGHGGLDLPADPKRIFGLIERFSPAMAGMSSQTFANLKSRLRKAFRLADAHLKPARSQVKLHGSWAELYAELQVPEQRTLSRFMRYGCAQGWDPEDVDDACLVQFGEYLRDEALVAGWEQVVRSTIHAWNRIVDTTNLSLKALTPPARKVSRYWISEDDLPETLRKDISSFLDEVSKVSGFAGISKPKLKPTTIRNYRQYITTMVSALVADGIPLSELTSLGMVATADNLTKVLHFLHARAGDQVTIRMLQLSVLMRTIATWSGLPEDELERVNEVVGQVYEARPNHRSMTEKNRNVLKRLDEPRFRDLVLLLPMAFARLADIKTRQQSAASYARAAIVVELLLLTGMRSDNLTNLKLGSSIRKFGKGKEARWIIDLDGLVVKNGDPLRFEIGGQSAELLEWYLREWRPKLCQVATQYLFPRGDGGPIDGGQLTTDIGNKIERELGERITMHQFRHIGADLYMREHPEGLGVISEHLGHRDTRTTRIYAPPKQREATRRYQEHLMSARSEVEHRHRAGKSRRRPARRCVTAQDPVEETGIEDATLEEQDVEWL